MRRRAHTPPPADRPRSNNRSSRFGAYANHTSLRTEKKNENPTHNNDQKEDQKKTFQHYPATLRALLFAVVLMLFLLGVVVYEHFRRTSCCDSDPYRGQLTVQPRRVSTIDAGRLDAWLFNGITAKVSVPTLHSESRILVEVRMDSGRLVDGLSGEVSSNECFTATSSVDDVSRSYSIYLRCAPGSRQCGTENAVCLEFRPESVPSVFVVAGIVTFLLLVLAFNVLIGVRMDHRWMRQSRRKREEEALEREKIVNDDDEEDDEAEDRELDEIATMDAHGPRSCHREDHGSRASRYQSNSEAVAKEEGEEGPPTSAGREGDDDLAGVDVDVGSNISSDPAVTSSSHQERSSNAGSTEGLKTEKGVAQLH